MNEFPCHLSDDKGFVQPKKKRNIAHVTSCHKRRQPWLRNGDSWEIFIKGKDIRIEILFIFTFRLSRGTDSRILFCSKGISISRERYRSTSLFSWLFSKKTAHTHCNQFWHCLQRGQLRNERKVEHKRSDCFLFCATTSFSAEVQQFREHPHHLLWALILLEIRSIHKNDWKVKQK